MNRRISSEALLDLARSVGPEKLAEALAQQARELLEGGMPEENVRGVMQSICETLDLDLDKVMPWDASNEGSR